MTRYISLAALLLLVTVAFAIGSSFEAGEWFFEKVEKPSWAPTPWVMGPIWAAFYTLMALAAGEVWETGHFDRIKAMAWWLLLLVLLQVWSVLFFGMHRPGWAWMELCLVLGVAFLCARAFRPLSQPAFYLMLPGLLWMVFFWLLNFFSWNMSGGPLDAYLP